MSRYIDADKLKEVITANDYLLVDHINSKDRGMFTVGIMQAIDELPTADVVEAPVRCRDCAYYIERQGCDRESQVSYYPPAYTVNFEPDDFCSYGERKVQE